MPLGYNQGNNCHYVPRCTNTPHCDPVKPYVGGFDAVACSGDRCASGSQVSCKKETVGSRLRTLFGRKSCSTVEGRRCQVECKSKCKKTSVTPPVPVTPLPVTPLPVDPAVTCVEVGCFGKRR